MMVDPDTARNLELVGNMMLKKSSHSLFGYATSFSKRAHPNIHYQ